MDRKNYIGGSDIASICGLGLGFKTPVEVFIEKTEGKRAEEKEVTQKVFERGHILEPFIRRLYEKKEGVTVEIIDKDIRHKDYDYIRGHIDGYVKERKSIVEFKTSFLFLKKKHYGEEHTDQIKESYLLQGAWYLMVNPEAKSVIFPCLFAHEKEFDLIIKQIEKYGIEEAVDNFADYGLDLKTYKSDRNEKLEKELLRIGTNFFEENMKKGIPPKWESLQDLKLLFPAGNKDENVLANDEDIALVKLYLEKDAMLKKLDKELTELKTYFCGRVGKAENLITTDGKKVFTWKTELRNGLDQGKFKKEYPEIYKECYSQGYCRKSKFYPV